MTEASQTLTPETQLFRDVFNASPIGIAVENLQGEPLFVNPAFCAFLGFSEQELRSKHCVDFSPPEDAEKDWALFQQLRAGSIDHYQLEKRYFRRDGSLVWGSLSISLLYSRPSPLVIAMVQDITDKKTAEEALRASEERLRLAQQAARIGSFEWNIETGLNTWTPELEAIYGLPPGGFGGTQTAFENLVHPNDRAAVIELVDGALRTGQPAKAEWRVIWPDGTVHWIAGRWQVFTDASGELSRMIGVNIDVTERKQAEEALRESERRLRLAVQAGNMYAYDWDVATDKVVRSEEFTDILGSTEPSCLTRKQFLARVHPDDRGRFIAAVDKLTPENPTTEITYRVVRADGAVIWLEKHGRAFFDSQGRMLRVFGMVADVTERKRSEERLREYEKAVEGAEDMIGVIDREYRFLLANRQYLKMQNLTREQVVGHFIPEVLNREIFETAIKPKLDECFQGKVVRYEMKFSYPMVGERDLLLSYFPIEGVNGVDRAACILHDITDRKRAEEALSGMTRKLIEAQEQERARIGRELHDDTNQRLAMLAVELGRLQEDPSESQTRLQELRKQVTEISNDVQALSHDLHSSKLEYLGAVGGIKSWCKEFAERQNVEIDFRSSVQSGLPLEVGRTLFRVLQEALHNSIKHSGVKRVGVQLLEDGGEIHLVVGDLGKGFDLETALQGRGLGLISMRERVRLVNGTIVIESKPMVGTTIHVRVPLEPGQGLQRAAG